MDKKLNNSIYVDFSICTINGNLHITGAFSVLAKFISVFICDEKGHPLRIQIAEDVFLQKLHTVCDELKATDPSLYVLVEFIEKIRMNEKFLLVSGNINADKSLNNLAEYKRLLYEINNVSYPIKKGEIERLYKIFCWGDGEKKAYIGEHNRQNRVCRFCEKKSPEVTFKHRAHAISESLGNKLLICNEECDICNKKIFSPIEQEFFNAHNILYSLYQKKGKEGIPSIKGKSIKIDNKNKNGGLEIKSERDFSFDNIDSFDDLDLIIDEPSLKYTPQDIYKCLCKFAVSLIDKEYLKSLSKTIHWLRSDSIVKRLPTVWRRHSKMHDQPLIGIYVKKPSADLDLPEFVIRLHIINIEYLYILPFVNDDDVVLSESARYRLIDLFDLSTYTEIDLSSDEKKSMQIHVELNVPEGTKFVTINKSEFDTLSDEERKTKYPNISGFFFNTNA